MKEKTCHLRFREETTAACGRHVDVGRLTPDPKKVNCKSCHVSLKFQEASRSAA